MMPPTRTATSTAASWLTLCLAFAMAAGCGGDATVSIEVSLGDPVTPAPSDPPYRSAVAYPSGLRLNLASDRALTGSYPSPGLNPFGTSRSKHYERVVYFIDLSRAPVSAQVSTNFKLSEYVDSVS